MCVMTPVDDERKSSRIVCCAKVLLARRLWPQEANSARKIWRVRKDWLLVGGKRCGRAKRALRRQRHNPLRSRGQQAGVAEDQLVCRSEVGQYGGGAEQVAGRKGKRRAVQIHKSRRSASPGIT
eukprot:5443356-Prymnesium_polylepis.2